MSLRSIVLMGLALTAVAGAWTGCTRQSPTAGLPAPHDVLASYIGEVFTVKGISDLDRLKAYTTGEAKNELEQLAGNEELFRKTFVDQKIQSASSLRIRDERKLDDSRYSITYELTYLDHTSSGNDTVTAKKHVILSRGGDGKWLIAEVKNLKTFVEHTTEESISGTLKK